MHILITAGGTSEPIDSVRSITNTSTGRLAVCIHQAWIEYNESTQEDLTIHYVVAKGAARPKVDKQTILYEVTDTASVKETIEMILTSYEIDAMIHLMAISDYYVHSVLPVSHLARTIAEHVEQVRQDNREISVEEIESILLGDKTSAIYAKGEKVPSGEEVYLRLDKNPKLISSVKSLSPDTRLIGFKLLNEVSEKELVEVAAAQEAKNGCEFVVANDLSKIEGERHEALFVKDGKIIARADSKEGIAEEIVKHLS